MPRTDPVCWTHTHKMILETLLSIYICCTFNLNNSISLLSPSLSMLLFSVWLVSVSYLQWFPELGSRHHGPAGATSQDDPEGKNENDFELKRRSGKPVLPGFILFSALTRGQNPFMFVKNKNERSPYSVFIKCECASIVTRVALGGKNCIFENIKPRRIYLYYSCFCQPGMNF